MKVYSTDCPQCKVLIKKLEQQGIDFTLIEDKEEVYRVASEHNIQSVPFIIYQDKLYLFSEAIKLINTL